MRLLRRFTSDAASVTVHVHPTIGWRVSSLQKCGPVADAGTRRPGSTGVDGMARGMPPM
jgi:hypothetical protein